MQLELGQVLKVGLTLAIGGVAESVQVKGESPLIDVKQNAAGADIQQEVIDRVPKGRDFTAIATSAPGIDNESRNSGIQIDGASGADNRFVIDGSTSPTWRAAPPTKSCARLHPGNPGQGERLQRR